MFTLCEIDHLDRYDKLLKELGYEYYTEKRRDFDYLIIAFRPSIFKYISHYGIQHDKLGELFQPVKGSTANDFLRGNCSVFVVLEHLETQK